MQLTFDQKDLAQSAGIVANLLKRSATTLPVLSNLLLEAAEGQATFAGTDQESHVTVRVPCEIVGAGGKLTLPADKLSELVGLLPSASSVKLDDQGGQVVISCEQSQYKLVTLPADDFPRWPAETVLTRFSVTQQQLKALLDAVLYAVPARDHRRVLMGVLLELRDGVLRFTATDGKKLSRMSVAVADAEGQATARVVVSGKLMGDVRRALSSEGPVAFEIGEHQVCIRIGNVEYRTNAIEGKYPDCDAVIPREFGHHVRLNRDNFQLAARRAGVVSDDRSKSIILKFTDGSCAFTSMAADVGTFDGKVGVEYEGGAIEVAFNYQLLIETLNSFSHPDIRLEIKNETAPTVFLCDEEKDHLCVLMPIKLADIRPGGGE